MAEYDGNNMLITLEDDEGITKEYEQIDSMELEGETYVALVPNYEDPTELVEADGELVILKTVYDDQNGEIMYVTIDDDFEFDKVAKAFEKRFEDNDDYEILQ